MDLSCVVNIHIYRVEAMRRKPWHWPNHVSLFPLSPQNVSLNIKSDSIGGGHSVQKSYVGHDLLDWKDFVDRPLSLQEYDGEENNNNNAGGIDGDVDESKEFCQKGYAHNTVSPCRSNFNYIPEPLQKIPKGFLRHLPFDTHNPIYEHNPIDGRPFENLLQLRAVKVKNFLSLPERWELAGIGFLQYDNLLGTGQLESLTKDIGRTLGMSHACPSLAQFEKTPYNLTDDFRDWITQAVQWDVESLIGYHRPAL